ncbi:Lipin/Ned1/Smp2-domain-containing protein [Dissophora ornata]|nr:Lipin/Ned1/Smp2-domain-containing protein [Dissophora ornata]
MQSVGSFFSTVSKFYNELNPATLSGAIDVVVVEQPNGDLACSPFHVRFGKLSILRPQEKVVEVTINGHVVDFPMKVGDAGEAFFVFETEQDVPEEFVTSPLAGPFMGKVEEEIDFLDLAQGGNNTNASALQQDDQDTGYVSAHSGHGSEFEEEEQESFSPQSSQRQDSASTLDFRSLSGLADMGSLREVQAGSAVKSRLSTSISLPSSPVLKARDIMENFQPVDSVGPFVGDVGDTQDRSPAVRPLIPISSESSNKNGFLSPHKDEVIMDMTGYKTDDSAETDLESDEPSMKDPKVRYRGRRKHGRPLRSVMRFTAHSPDGKGGEVDPLANVEQEADPRWPLRPIQHSLDRPLASGFQRRRSSSLPNLEDSEISVSLHKKLASIAKSASSLSDSTQAEMASSLLKGFGVTSSSPLSQTSQGSTSRHHRQQQHGGNDLSKTYPRRLSHKPTQTAHTKKPTARPNLALSALSDTELEYQTPRSAMTAQDPEWTWGWGGLPVKNDSVDDMAEADQKDKQANHVSIDVTSPPKPVLNEMEVEGAVYRVAISLCPGDDFGKDLEASEALFATNQILFDEFAKDPLKILSNKSLVCLINDRYFTWAAAGPYLASLMLFRKPLSDETLQQLSVKDVRHLSDRSPVPEPSTRFGALSRWLRGSQASSHLDSMEQAQHSSPLNPDSAPRKQKNDRHKETRIANGPYSDPETEFTGQSTTTLDNTPSKELVINEEKQQAQARDAKQKSNKRYAKTLRLTSEQLRSLNLKKGSNTLTFSVTSSYQGKAVCSAKLFLWEHDYQVVISDIDGTITKSDALGHIFTMAGKDWTHTGVAKLYTDIVNNGYHILYLTSRAIGQADYTRKYLKNVEQDSYQLPDGPVIMSPDRLMTAFHREVIMRKPEEFKMACLRDIRRVFGDRNPFYAGFGNRITDALSYRSVNVPSSKIFTIDSGGEVKLELLSSYKSSYLALNDLVNEIFPGKRHAPEFNDWNYWKPSLPTIELPLAPSDQPTLPLTPIEIGPSRLGVIRSFTSSFTSSGPPKTRPSIPAFNSTQATSPPSSSATSPRLTSVSTAAPPPPPTLGSAPAGPQIAERTRRLSFSLKKFGNSGAIQPGSPPSSTSLDFANDQYAAGAIVVGAGADTTDGQWQAHGTRVRGMSMTSDSGYVPSNLSASPPTLYTSSPPSAGAIHPIDITTIKTTSSFSVSPPPLASRLTETVIPFLRGRTSKPEQDQSQGQGQGHDEMLSVSEDNQLPERQDDSPYGYVDEPYEDDDGQEGEEGDDYDEDYGEEEEEDDLLDDDDDDVELDIDAPFL